MTLRFKAFATKAMKIVLVALMTLTCFTYVNNVSAEETSETSESTKVTFDDVKVEDWSNKETNTPLDHYLGMSWMAETKISTGYTEGNLLNFRPLEELTRSQMAAFLYRYAVHKGLTTKAAVEAKVDFNNLPFSDIQEYANLKDDLFYGMIWLADAKISTGWDDGKGGLKFEPNANIKRADMAAFLYRLAKLMKYVDEANVEYEHKFADVDKAAWTDKDKVLDHYYGMAWMASVKISTGWPIANSDKANFEPLQNIKRADMAAFLYRFDQLKKDTKIKLINDSLIEAEINEVTGIATDKDGNKYVKTVTDPEDKYEKLEEGKLAVDKNDDGKADAIEKPTRCNFLNEKFPERFHTDNIAVDGDNQYYDFNGDGVCEPVTRARRHQEAVENYTQNYRLSVLDVNNITKENLDELKGLMNSNYKMTNPITKLTYDPIFNQYGEELGDVPNYGEWGDTVGLQESWGGMKQLITNVELENDKVKLTFFDDSTLLVDKDKVFALATFYTVSDDGTKLTISNKKTESSKTEQEWHKRDSYKQIIEPDTSQRKNITEVVIEEGTSVKFLEYFFYGFESLETVDVTELFKNQTVKLQTIQHMFENCKKLKEIKGLDVLNQENSNLLDLISVFQGCTSLTSIDGVQNWNVSNVGDISGFIASTPALSDLSPVKDWKIAPTNINYTFNDLGISSPEALANWDMSKLTYAERVFFNCLKLENVKGLEKWDLSSLKSLMYFLGTDTPLTSTTDEEGSTTPSNNYPVVNLTGLAAWKDYKITYVQGCFRNLKFRNLEEIKDWKPVGSYYNFQGAKKEDGNEITTADIPWKDNE